MQNFQDITESQLLYEELLANSTRSRICGLLVPDYECSALLLAAHILFHYAILYPSSYDRGISIRLSELSKLADIMATPNFDVDKFIRLVSNYKASDCVEFAVSLLKSYSFEIQIVITDLFNSSNPQRLFPRWLAGWKCWEHYHHLDELLLPTDPILFIKELGFNTIAASTNGLKKFVYLCLPPKKPSINRAIIHLCQFEQFEIALAATWGKESLELSVLIVYPPLNNHSAYQIAIHGGRHIEECILGVDYYFRLINNNISLVESSPVQTNPEAFIKQDGSNLIIKINLPWSILPPSANSTGKVILWLIVQRQDELAPVRISDDPVAIIPVEIIREL